jgi:hypothetical protein
VCFGDLEAMFAVKLIDCWDKVRSSSAFRSSNQAAARQTRAGAAVNWGELAAASRPARCLALKLNGGELSRQPLVFMTNSL